MSRFIAKSRDLTQEERIAAHKERIFEAEIDVANAEAELERVKNANPPLTTTDYVEVKPGEPGYDEATFESYMIGMARDVIKTMPNQSPWTGLIQRGEYPKGLGNL